MEETKITSPTLESQGERKSKRRKILLKDLCVEDKQKVAHLILQINNLTNEKSQLQENIKKQELLIEEEERKNQQKVLLLEQFQKRVEKLQLEKKQKDVKQKESLLGFQESITDLRNKLSDLTQERSKIQENNSELKLKIRSLRKKLKKVTGVKKRNKKIQVNTLQHVNNNAKSKKVSKKTQTVKMSVSVQANRKSQNRLLDDDIEAYYEERWKRQKSRRNEERQSRRSYETETESEAGTPVVGYRELEGREYVGVGIERRKSKFNPRKERLINEEDEESGSLSDFSEKFIFEEEENLFDEENDKNLEKEIYRKLKRVKMIEKKIKEGNKKIEQELTKVENDEETPMNTPRSIREKYREFEEKSSEKIKKIVDEYGENEIQRESFNESQKIRNQLNEKGISKEEEEMANISALCNGQEVKKEEETDKEEDYFDSPKIYKVDNMRVFNKKKEVKNNTLLEDEQIKEMINEENNEEDNYEDDNYEKNENNEQNDPDNWFDGEAVQTNNIFEIIS